MKHTIGQQLECARALSTFFLANAARAKYRQSEIGYRREVSESVIRTLMWIADHEEKIREYIALDARSAPD